MKEELIKNIDKIHTTELGLLRIKRNIKNNKDNVIEYIKNLITDNNCKVERKGKNYYCYINDIVITINSYSYTIITAHII